VDLPPGEAPAASAPALSALPLAADAALALVPFLPAFALGVAPGLPGASVVATALAAEAIAVLVLAGAVAAVMAEAGRGVATTFITSFFFTTLNCSRDIIILITSGTSESHRYETLLVYIFIDPIRDIHRSSNHQQWSEASKYSP
jgi:hypothetical protein